ncbi:hypothetical protein CFC21_005561 [Triticum aestivum]|uniref:Uncharacterized protein n=2 Tax=Triticum aestivum TaxID=4565 RepID=A0A9R1DA62_WHEAT|nr:hypothetical protein CFC21_005561 [Triticum aestivum]
MPGVLPNNSSRVLKAFRVIMNCRYRVPGDVAAGARQEVQRLKPSASQLQAAMQELQSSGLHSDDAGIGAAEARKTDLMAKKAKLDETLAATRQFRALLR